MIRYCVSWSNDGFFHEDDVKIFEDYQTAKKNLDLAERIEKNNASSSRKESLLVSI